MKTTSQYIIDKDGNLVVPMTTTDAVIDVSTKVTLKTDLTNIKQQVTNVVKSPTTLNNNEIILGSTGNRNVKSSGLTISLDAPTVTSGNGTVPTTRAVYLGIKNLADKTFLQFTYNSSAHTFSIADLDIVDALVRNTPVLFKDENNFYYVCTYIDTTLQRIRFMGVNQNEDNFIELEFTYTEPSKTLTWVATTNRIYARIDGQYEGLGAGIIVPKDSDTIIDGDEEAVSYLFRSTAGNESVSDGSAYIMRLEGNIVDGVPTNPTHIKAVGFNAFNTEHVIAHAKFDNNGTIVEDLTEGNSIIYVKVLKGISGVGENNGYGINRNGSTVTEDVSVAEVRWCPLDSSLAVGLTGTTPLTLSNNYNSQSYITPDEGYMLIQTKSTDGICVHLCWSGYRDADYAVYSESIVSVNQNFPHTWGLGKAGALRDIIDLHEKKGYINVESYTFSISTQWEESYSAVDGYTYRSQNIASLIEPNTTNISCYEMIDVMGYSITITAGGYIALNSGQTQLTPSTDIYGTLYYEPNQKISYDIPSGGIGYYVSDFGTEEFLGTSVAPTNIISYYSPNLVDSLRSLIQNAVTSVDNVLSPISTNPVQNKTITEALNGYAKTDGIYPGISAGNLIAENTDYLNTENANYSFIYRTSAGDANISDGIAKMVALKGYTDSTGNSFSAKKFKSVVFNMFDANSDIIPGYALNSNGNVIAASGYTLCYCRALATESGQGNSQGYYINQNVSERGSYPYVGYSSEIPTTSSTGIRIISASTSIDGRTVYNTDNTGDNPGYLVFSSPNISGLLVNIAWSYEPDPNIKGLLYKEDIIEIPYPSLHDWYGKIDDASTTSSVYDELDTSNEKIYTRVDRLMLGGASWIEIPTEHEIPDPEDAEQTITYYTYIYKSEDLVGTIKESTTLINCINIDASYGISIDVSGNVLIDTSTSQVTPSSEFANYILYYELKNVIEENTDFNGAYYVGDFGTEEFIDYTYDKVPPSEVTIYYLINLKDGLRNLLTSSKYISYTLDFGRYGTEMNDMNIQDSSAKVHSIGTMNVSTLKVTIGATTKTIDLTSSAETQNITIPPMSGCTWTIERINNASPACVGLKVLAN